MKSAVSIIVAAAMLAAGSYQAAAAQSRTETAVLAGGCFWGMEGVFESLKGVTNVVSGFAGGNAQTAHYELVSTGTTGHAESVEITYDPKRISYGRLLDVFFRVAHDPTQLNRQGPDDGSQYRSAIFYTSDAQRKEALTYIERMRRDKVFSDPIVTQVVPLRGFYAAESYHQHFMRRNPYYPYILINDAPKLKHLREKFPQLVKN